jgi:transcription antitermination factor NusG
MQGGGRWYLAYSLPNREEHALIQLANQNISGFLPKSLKSVRHARRIETKLVAYFPRYLFVRLDLSRDRWRSVNGTFGIAYLVGPGDLPEPVPVGVVETLLSCSDHRGVINLGELQLGQRVRMTAGPFAEQIGVLDRLDATGRVRVLLEIMGGLTPVEARRDYLVAAG